MLIRKNTKAFKTILEIVTTCQNRTDREKFIRLYITRAGNSIHDRISTDAIQGDADLFYNMNYETVLNSLNSSDHQLHYSDEIPGIYFFHSNSNKAWDETPFEFDPAIKNEFASLPELPSVRKKEKPQKFVFPSGKAKTGSQPTQTAKVKTQKVAKAVEEGTKQPSYKLGHKIQFTELDKVVFRQTKVTKNDILDYYYKMAEYILPYLKDRPQLIRLQSDQGRTTEYPNLADLVPEVVDVLPDWIKTISVAEGTERKQLLLCNDKDHLLFYAQIGCLQFSPWHSRAKSLESPDYIVIGIDPPEAAFGKAIGVALTAEKILTGLKLPCFVKTDGVSGLHIYIPLDSKSTFEVSKKVGKYICKLIRLKIPDQTTLNESEEYSYGKVSLDYLVNEKGKTVVAPYSILPGQLANVAAPLLWEELKEGLRLDDFNYATIFKRHNKIGDPFATLFKKKINADALLESMEDGYSFLF